MFLSAICRHRVSSPKGLDKNLILNLEEPGTHRRTLLRSSRVTSCCISFGDERHDSNFQAVTPSKNRRKVDFFHLFRPPLASPWRLNKQQRDRPSSPFSWTETGTWLMPLSMLALEQRKRRGGQVAAHAQGRERSPGPGRSLFFALASFLRSCGHRGSSDSRPSGSRPGSIQRVYHGRSLHRVWSPER
jgi:hypothetical protein